MRSIPPQRQTLFFSATWPREVKAIAAQFVTHDTVHVFVGGVEEKLVANKAITQFVEIMDSYSKMNRLGQVRPRGARPWLWICVSSDRAHMTACSGNVH